MATNNFNYGTQGLEMNNWNLNAMVPSFLMDAQNPYNSTNPLGIEAGRKRTMQEYNTPLIQNNPYIPPNPINTQQTQSETQNTFGTPNWGWINISNALQSGLSYASNYFGDSRQNAILDYNKQKFNPLNYLARTSNTSMQDRYGTPYFEDGGEIDQEEEDYLYGPDEELYAPSDNQQQVKNKKQVKAEEEAKKQAISDIDEINASNFYNSLSFNNYDSDTPNPFIDSNNRFAGIFRIEGASTGQPTNLNSSAIGRGQMIKGTREAMYKKLGIKDFASAEKAFKTDPNFEMTILNTYRDELDSRIPKSITGSQREYMIAKGWYTGDVNYPDNIIPGKEAGNKLTAGEYARKAIGMEEGGILEELKKGGIHIDPKNKGKFNETKKRTGKSTEELTHSKNPLTRKRAIFAQNAKKWKHEEGGLIYQQDEEYDVTPEELERLKSLGYTIEIL